jgi:hypothetical protein
MAESLKTLIKIQGQIAQCRRLAIGIFDKETSDRLFAMANEIEHRAREVDLAWGRNEWQGSRLS